MGISTTWMPWPLLAPSWRCGFLKDWTFSFWTSMIQSRYFTTLVYTPGYPKSMYFSNIRNASYRQVRNPDPSSWSPKPSTLHPHFRTWRVRPSRPDKYRLHYRIWRRTYYWWTFSDMSCGIFLARRRADLLSELFDLSKLENSWEYWILLRSLARTSTVSRRFLPPKIPLNMCWKRPVGKPSSKYF